MKHVEVYENFERMFPERAIFVEDWFPNGKNSVRVRIKNGSDFIFTYNSWVDWCFETVESYIRKMKGGRQMNARLYDSSDKNE